jgi:hypothetical protein
MSGKKTPA